jgi:mRNA interferase MazF
LLEVDPSKRNGLREFSQIAIDKITVVPAAKIGGVIGEASDALLLRVNRALALFLGFVWFTYMPATASSIHDSRV